MVQRAGFRSECVIIAKKKGLSAKRSEIHQIYCMNDVKQIHAAKKTFTSFDDMIRNSKVPVLVDFYAAW